MNRIKRFPKPSLSPQQADGVLRSASRRKSLIPIWPQQAAGYSTQMGINIGLVLNLKEIDGAFRYVINVNYLDSIMKKKPKGIDLRIIKITYEDNLDLIDLDGVILIGGGKCYKKVKEKPTLYQANPKRYTFEKKLVLHCFNKGIPLLGICRGFQMMNEVFGGKIDYIHKKTDINHGSRKEKHSVRIIKGSRLSEIYKKPGLFVDSFHLKEVVQVSNKFKVSAMSQDGVIEAIESNFSPFFLGVQWHPESLKNSDSSLLFNYFITYCLESQK